MAESIEQPKKYPTYPIEADVLELQRIADTKATGANEHRVKAVISAINVIMIISKRKGWDEEHLKKFNECKIRLYEILSGVKTE